MGHPVQRPLPLQPEVLAPAGGRESLEAAVRAGADAVYLGGKSLNARRGAANFDDDALAEAVRYCHVRGVRVYLTLNTLVFDDELAELENALRGACAAGVDALIVQDLAVARLARRRCPDLPLHASTQMSVHDGAGARLLAELGFTRVVLARELSRAEIAAIRKNSGIELECFVHGALCMSVSGQCYISSMLGGRSGNRGLCAQPCRLPFSAGGRENVLSLRDLSLIGSAGELGDLGVCSLKIEGRMKRPEYVAAAVHACRQALAGEPPDYAALEAVFSRAGFTRGYYDGKLGRAMFGIRRKEDVQSAAPVLRQLAALYKDECPAVPVDFALVLRRGLPAALRAADRDGNIAHVTGEPPQEARTAPTDREKAAAALSKTGGTPYTVGNIVTDIDEGLMLPASQLNALRRDALEALTALRGKPAPHPYWEEALPETPPQRNGLPPAKGARPWLRARLARASQLTRELAATVDQLVLPAEEFAHLQTEAVAKYADKLLVEIPGIVFERQEKLLEILQSVKSAGVSGAMVGGLGGIGIAREAGLAAHGDYGLNIANRLALAAYGDLGLADATASFELELPRLKRLGGERPQSGLPLGILAYGHLPLMTTRNCPAGAPSAEGCGRCRRSFPTVTDRKGNKFFVDCVWQVSRLYNYLPLFLADRLDEFAGLDFLTLYFTREPAERCAAIARQYRAGAGEPEGGHTRGLYYRKVL